MSKKVLAYDGSAGIAQASVVADLAALRDYARIDIRLTADDEVWVLEANANPCISKGHEMATAAARAGARRVRSPARPRARRPPPP